MSDCFLSGDFFMPCFTNLRYTNHELHKVRGAPTSEEEMHRAAWTQRRGTREVRTAADSGSRSRAAGGAGRAESQQSGEDGMEQWT